MPTVIEFWSFPDPAHRREVLAEGRPMTFGERAFARRARWSCAPARLITASNCTFGRMTVKAVEPCGSIGVPRTAGIGCAGRPAKSRWCKSITMKE
jgi:hypothetical protein